MTNFDYLKQEPKFSAFADAAISAEKIILIDPDSSILTARRAMEFAVKWMYSVDSSLEYPYQDNLQSLMDAEDFRQLVGHDIWRRMKFIRLSGNNVAQAGKKVGFDAALLCLENLAIFIDFISCCYSSNYEEHIFTAQYIQDRKDKVKQKKAQAEETKAQLEQQLNELKRQQEELEKQALDFKKLMEENESLKEELSKRRQEQQQTYNPKPLDLSEYKTRKIYMTLCLWMRAGRREEIGLMR